MSGFWKPGIAFDVLGTHVELQNLRARRAAWCVVAWLSLALTPTAVHADNEFSWGPMEEVAKLFAGIFITIVPVIAMLRAGKAGAFAPRRRAVTDADGTAEHADVLLGHRRAVSSFLDNAPTYLVFFNLAGGDAQALMTTLATDARRDLRRRRLHGRQHATSATRRTSWSRRSPRSAASRCRASSATWLWSFAILMPLFVLLTFIFFR